MMNKNISPFRAERFIYFHISTLLFTQRMILAAAKYPFPQKSGRFCEKKFLEASDWFTA